VSKSMRKAARLAASDTHHRERKGADSVSRAVPIEVQDHHAVEGAEPRGYWSLSACPQFRRAIAKFRSFKTIQMYGDRAVAGFAVPSVGRRRPAEEPISRRGGR
jgi:hypothetical protein